jgi:hypothetical protein
MDDVTLARRMVELERKVQYLFQHLGLDEHEAAHQPNAGPSQRVIDLAQSGRPLDAIREYQAEAGCSLAEAKEVVGGLTP